MVMEYEWWSERETPGETGEDIGKGAVRMNNIRPHPPNRAVQVSNLNRIPITADTKYSDLDTALP